MSNELTIILGVLAFLITILTTTMTVTKYFASKVLKVKEEGKREGKLDMLIENLIKEVRLMSGKLESMEAMSNKQTYTCSAHRDETALLKQRVDKAWERIDSNTKYINKMNGGK